MAILRQPYITFSTAEDALLVFADIIESSIYSSVWGYEQYANQLLKFQSLFVQLGESFFPSQNPITTFYDVKARGDEGTVFCVDPNRDPGDLIYNALQFAFELKARMELVNDNRSPDSDMPRKMKVGIGIHFGRVALMAKSKTDENTGRSSSIIDHIEGFSINYAKRVESSSRNGKYSKIFLSKEAASLLEGDPIVLVRHNALLKGIEKDEELFEVRSAFFEKIPHESKILDIEKFIDAYSSESKEKDLIREPWLKGLIVSILNSCSETAQDPALKNKYLKKISDFAWKKPFDDDPIILFCRAKECLSSKQFTRSLTYFKKIVEKYPYFIHARKKLVEICWEIANRVKESSELIYARDIAQEFLQRFPKYLTAAEKDNFKKILRKVSKRTKRKTKR